MRNAMLAVILLLVGVAVAAPIEPLLVEQMEKAQDGERLGVMIALNEQLDAENIIRNIKDKQERWEHTVSSLKAMSARTQASLLAELRSAEAAGSVADIKSLWIVNAVYCEATPEVIEQVAQRDEIWFVQWDKIPTEDALGLSHNAADKDVVDGSFTVEWNVKKVKADSVWAVYGLTGDGVVVGNIDTGCDYTHPDLADHLWTDPNYAHNGWDFENNDDDPMDSQGHGTHTCGTHSGDGTGGDTTGMAPNSLVMSCRTKTSISRPYPDTIAENTVMNSMQFCVAPPLSPENHADLLTMSLGWIIRLWSPRQALWRQSVGNVAAAGLPFFIAAGNEGSSRPPINLRCPGNAPSPWHHPAAESGGVGGSISIGATDNADNYASFTSWGPVEWDTIAPYNDYPYPPGLLKPDFSAPGVNVVSTRRGGGYTQMSGTSMATPCAAGVCALMLEKNPNLLPEQVDEIMQGSVLPRGTQPKNNTYGTGRIDAMLCIANTPSQGGPPQIRLQGTSVFDPPPGGNNNGRVDPGETAKLRAALRNMGAATSENTMGTLVSGHADITVSDANGDWGAILPGSTKVNVSDDFEVMASSSIQPGSSFPCTLHVTGDSADYSETFVFMLTVGEPPTPGAALMTHDTGYCKLSVTCFGPIGYDLPPSDAGAGFCYPKTSSSALFYSSFAIGQSPSYVADRHFGQPASGSPNSDLAIEESLRVYVDPDADEVFRGVFDDDGHPSPKGIEVDQYSYQNADPGYDDFVAIQYVIKNTSGQTINDLYAGIFADFDIGSSPTSNTCTSDEARRLTYMRQSSSANPTVGVKILYPASFANLAAIDHALYVYPTDSCMTDGQKFRFLDGTIANRNSNRAYDWSVCTSVGPFDLGPRTAYPVWFAFVGGSSVSEAQAHADSAQSWFDNNVSLLEGPGRIPVAERVLDVRPNPFTGKARVRYQTSQAGRVRISAFDISGRTVQSILDADVAAGRGEVAWQPAELANGVYVVRLESPDGITTSRVLLSK